MGTVEGRVGGAIGGYSVNADVSGGRARGRIGGGVFGSDINLAYSFESGELSGRIGGMIIGRSVTGTVTHSELYVRIGGAFDGNDIQIRVQDNKAWGRCGGGMIGFDIDLDFLDGGEVRGRLGGDFVGHSIDAMVNGVDTVIAAALFTITYYMYRVNHRGHSSGGSSGGK